MNFLTGDQIIQALAPYLPAGIRLAVTLRRNRRTLLGLRGSPGAWKLTLHPALTLNADWSVFIGEWLQRHGRGGAGTHLRELIATCRKQLNRPDQATLARISSLPILAGPFDLASELRRVHGTWFADLPLPNACWSRRPPQRRLTHLRFGCYRRIAPGTVELNPRLDRPWIARCFVEHVLHHELCHHRQAYTPLNQHREPPHSRRFRIWERTYPQLDDALLWERHALPWLLDDAQPPWYASTQEQPCTASPPSPA